MQLELLAQQDRLVLLGSQDQLVPRVRLDLLDQQLQLPSALYQLSLLVQLLRSPTPAQARRLFSRSAFLVRQQ